jgi:hypothetical protein
MWPQLGMTAIETRLCSSGKFRLGSHLGNVTQRLLSVQKRLSLTLQWLYQLIMFYWDWHIPLTSRARKQVAASSPVVLCGLFFSPFPYPASFIYQNWTLTLANCAVLRLFSLRMRLCVCVCVYVCVCVCVYIYITYLLWIFGVCVYLVCLYVLNLCLCRV